MNHNNANGSCVVEAVLDELRKSGVFEHDHEFMRRIAYVETLDGTETTHENDTETGCKKRIGIWGLTQDKLDTMKKYLLSEYTYVNYQAVKELSDRVCERFGVNMTGPERLNLRNPLVSGIAARFYLYYLTVLEREELPECVEEQAFFWKSHYTSSNFLDEAKFKEQVMELEGNYTTLFDLGQPTKMTA